MLTRTGSPLVLQIEAFRYSDRLGPHSCLRFRTSSQGLSSSPVLIPAISRVHRGPSIEQNSLQVEHEPGQDIFA